MEDIYEISCEPSGDKHIKRCAIREKETKKDVVHFTIRETMSGMIGFSIEFKPKGIIKED